MNTDPGVISSCERTFFERYQMELRFPVEPVSAISALVMCVITVFGPPGNVYHYKNNIPTEFWLAQAGTFLNGIGSFVFHSVHPDDYVPYGINPRILDSIAMAFMSVFTALLFVKGGYKMYASYFVLLYIFFVTWSNDFITYPFLYKNTNGLIAIGVQFPLMGFIYLYSILMITKTFTFNLTRPTLITLGIAFTCWMIDRVFCYEIDILSFFHMYWHIFGTYGNILLMCLGLRYQGYSLDGSWFPRISQEPYSFSKLLDSQV